MTMFSFQFFLFFLLHVLSWEIKVVESTYKYQEDSHSIYNTSAITMLLQWLPTLSPQLQQWLARRLYDLCTCGPLNKQRCCTGGVLKSVVEVLTTSQEDKGYFSDDVEGTVMCMTIKSTMSAVFKSTLVLGTWFLVVFGMRLPIWLPGVNFSSLPLSLSLSLSLSLPLTPQSTW